MMNLIDYMYYRCAKAYYRWDGETGITGIMAVTLFISLIIIDILGIIYFEVASEEQRMNNKGLSKGVAILIIILILLFFFKRYRNKYGLYNQKWINDDKRKRIINGILLVILFLIPIAIPFIFLNLL